MFEKLDSDIDEFINEITDKVEELAEESGKSKEKVMKILCDRLFIIEKLGW